MQFLNDAILCASSIDNGIIRFSYKNYKKLKTAENYKDIWEEAQLPAEEFIRRFLYHVLPTGYHRIRHFGFLSNGCKKKFHEIRNRLLEDADYGLAEKDDGYKSGLKCPFCENGIMTSALIVDGKGNIVKGSINELIRLKHHLDKARKANNNPDDKIIPPDTS